MNGIFQRIEWAVSAAWCLVLAVLFWPFVTGAPMSVKIAIEIPWLIICGLVYISIRRARRKRQ